MHANHTATTTTAVDLQLERLPSGELAWLRSDTDPDPRYVVTDQGRRALAVEALFGRPWPTAAEASA